ncbi:hypothetical protein T10_9360 [Trichinella papuae]|uniref:Uncharacterized protein n=1 Tax=Trichinella papuae TaxID=268474 RepID=A0A0V1N524_9BILA|nr:hypothetical protein T10_9360 [Trichinella papuae]
MENISFIYQIIEAMPCENCYYNNNCLSRPDSISVYKALKVALDKMQRHVEELHKNKLDFQYASKGVHFKSFNLYTWLEPEVQLPVLFQRLHTFKEYDKYPDIVELRDAMLSVASSHWERKKSTKTSPAVLELQQIEHHFWQ